MACGLARTVVDSCKCKQCPPRHHATSSISIAPAIVVIIVVSCITLVSSLSHQIITFVVDPFGFSFSVHIIVVSGPHVVCPWLSVVVLMIDVDAGKATL